MKYTIHFYITYLLHDIICLSETWLNESILSSELFDSRYHVVRRDRDHRFKRRFCKHHDGGVLMAISRQLDMDVRLDRQLELVEDLWVIE